jgi:hypothetical protein
MEGGGAMTPLPPELMSRLSALQALEVIGISISSVALALGLVIWWRVHKIEKHLWTLISALAVGKLTRR